MKSSGNWPLLGCWAVFFSAAILAAALVVVADLMALSQPAGFHTLPTRRELPANIQQGWE